MKYSQTMTLATAIAASFAFNVFANQLDNQVVEAAFVTNDKVTAKTLPMSDGEVKKVDKETGKITIKHGPIINLDMPGMTMVFKVKEETTLEQVKVGDKIKFTTEISNGALTVTKIEAANDKGQ